MTLNSDNPIRMVRELKGAPLSILLILRIVHQPVSNEFIEGATGYTDKPVRKALKYLQEIGLVVQNSKGWILSTGGQQLPLPLLDDGDGAAEEPVIIDGNTTEPIQECRNNSDLVNYLSNNININQVSKVSNGQKRKNSDLPPVIRENLETFRELNIQINRRTEALARLPHINREYILQTVNNLKQGELLGLAIIRMERGEKVATQQRSGRDSPESRRKYSEWDNTNDQN